MKKMIAVWLFLAFGLCGTLYFIGLNMEKEYKPYRELEADMVESASIYLTVNEIKLKTGEKKTINISELLKSGNLLTDTVKSDKCVGYVTVKKKIDDYQYDAYIKCKNYTTVDYEE